MRVWTRLSLLNSSVEILNRYVYYFDQQNETVGLPPFFTQPSFPRETSLQPCPFFLEPLAGPIPFPTS